MDKNTMIVAVIAIVAVCAVLMVMTLTNSGKPSTVQDIITPSNGNGQLITPSVGDDIGKSFSCPSAAELNSELAGFIQNGWVGSEWNGVSCLEVSQISYKGKTVCGYAFAGGMLESCSAVALYFDPTAATFESGFACESSIKSTACSAACEKLVAWQRGDFNPSGGPAPGMNGFGSVKPIEWACDKADNTVRAIFVNTVGQTITLTDSSIIQCSPTTILAGETTSCTIPATGECASVNAGQRYEETISITYITTSGITRTSTGTLWGAAE